ncbi:GIP [Symbiodinium sp. CCMP2592]|nr:GIP [Symbiodinium sp. CCMP2592]
MIRDSFAADLLLEKRYYCFLWCRAQTRANQRPWSRQAAEQALSAIRRLLNLCRRQVPERAMRISGKHGSEEVQVIVMHPMPELLESTRDDASVWLEKVEALRQVSNLHHSFGPALRCRWIAVLTGLLRRETDSGHMEQLLDALRCLFSNVGQDEIRTHFCQEVAQLDNLLFDLQMQNQARFERIKLFLLRFT